MPKGVFSLSKVSWYNQGSGALESWKKDVPAEIDFGATADHSYYTGGQIANIGAVTFTEKLSFSTETLTYVPSAQTNISRYYSTSVSNRSYSLILAGENLDHLLPGKYTTSVEKLTYATDTISTESYNILFGFSKGAAISDGLDNSDFFVAGGESLNSLGTNTLGNGVYKWEYSTSTMVRHYAGNERVFGSSSTIELNYTFALLQAGFPTSEKSRFQQELLGDTRVNLTGGSAGKFGFFAGGLYDGSSHSFKIDFLSYTTDTVFRLPFLYDEAEKFFPLGFTSTWDRLISTPGRTNFPSSGLFKIPLTLGIGAYGGIFAGFYENHPTRKYGLLTIYDDCLLEYPTAAPGLEYTSIFGGTQHNKINNTTLTIGGVYTTTPLLDRPYKTSTGAVYDAFIGGGTSSSSVIERINYTVDTKSTSPARLILPRYSMVGSGFLNRNLHYDSSNLNINSTLWEETSFGDFLSSQPQSNSIFHLTETITATPSPAPGYGLLVAGFQSDLPIASWFVLAPNAYGGVRHESQKINFSTTSWSLSSKSSSSEGRCSLASGSNSTHGYLSGGGQIGLFHDSTWKATFYSTSLVEKVSYAIETTKIAPTASLSQCRTAHSGLSNLSNSYWIGGYNIKLDDDNLNLFSTISDDYVIQRVDLDLSTDYIEEKTSFSTDTTSLVSSSGSYDIGVKNGATSFGNLSLGYVLGGSAAAAPSPQITDVFIPLQDPSSASYYGIKFTYSTETSTSFSSSSLGLARYSPQSLGNSSNGYLIGGKTSITKTFSFISTIEKISFSTGTVSTISANCQDRFLGNCIGNNTEGFVAGGYYGALSYQAQDRIEKLTYSTDTISSLPYATSELIYYVQDAGALSATGNGLPSSSSTTVSYS